MDSIMEQNQKKGLGLWVGYVIILIAIFGIAAGSYLLWQQYKPPKLEPPVPPTPAPPEAPKGIVETVVETVASLVPNKEAKTTPTPKSVFPLQKGSRGPEVKNLQRYINNNSIAKLDEDGIFGTKTETVLKNLWGTASVTQKEYNKMLGIGSARSSSDFGERQDEYLPGDTYTRAT